jgi:acyl carrier protein
MENREQSAREASLIRAVLASNSGGRYTIDTLNEGLALTSLGIDSLKFIVVILEIEAKLGRKIFNVGNVGGARTVADLVQIVVGSDDGASNHASA